MPLTSWRHVNSEGEIADTPARGWQYRYAQTFELDFSGDEATNAIGITLAAMGGVTLPLTGLWSGQVQGTWKLRVVVPGSGGGGDDGGIDDLFGETSDLFGVDLAGYGTDELTGSDGTTIFEQTVTLTYRVTALVTSVIGIPLLSLFTWHVERESIRTTVCGRALEPGEAPSTVGAEQGISDPASGTDYSSAQGSISSDWYSPIYNVMIPRGARVVVDFHNIGLAAAPSLLPISTRVIRSSASAVRDPRQGVSWVLSSTTDGLQVSSIMDTGAPGPFEGRVAMGGGMGWIFRFPNSTSLGVLAENMGELALYRSLAEGQEGTWRKVATITEAVQLAAACLSADGSTIYALGTAADNVLHAYHGRLQGGGGLSLEDMGPATGLSGGVEAGAVMEDRGGKLHMIVTGVTGHSYYYSRDGGVTWR